ncbi:epigen-like [Anableps anableps]
MFTQRQMYLKKPFAFTVTMLLLLATIGKSEVLSDSTLTTVLPSLFNSSLTDQIINSTMGQPKVQHLVSPCGEKNEEYCLNGGKCMYPQDSEQPSCVCKSSHSGPRCEIFTDLTYRPLSADKVIAIIFGLIMVFIVLALAICCFVKRRCVTSAPLIKAGVSETSV